ncbi:MAG: hypothetical protein QHC78_02955 [Pigmentiphaga sp.]|nr:hypothetical protein [Pigmentiphaga sp.]MDX3904633.1 hypothetical protein [Pigmentiphaga sp.]
MTRLFISSLILAACLACTPLPRSGGDSSGSSDGISVYGTIDTGIVIKP